MKLKFRSLEQISCKGEVAMSSKGNDSGIAAIGDFEPTADLSRNGVEEISSDLRRLLADVFALYLKTKNFHWHMSGRHLDRKSTRLNSSHVSISYAVFCLKKKN